MKRVLLPILHDQYSSDTISYNTDQYGVTWRRTGSCNRCGECCKGDPFSGSRPITVPGMCALFEWESEGVGKCSDRQHPHYLQGCHVYPQFPQQIEDKPCCSYVFEKVTDGYV